MRDERDELVLQPIGFDESLVLKRELVLRRLGERFEITTTRPLGYDRPWRRAVAPESDAPAPPRAIPPQPRDDDLEAGD